ncbi:MAG TPA: DUF2250 domain-containing protein [candidate division Zixibacteria bacterium]|nr:DUF2250 domain-containing protein [candidate division Zixibacteria bacterium]
MSDEIRLKEPYLLANCCSPTPDNSITGYYSHDGIQIKVHRSDCSNLKKADQARLVSLSWNDILDQPDFLPGDDYADLTETDWRVLELHRQVGVDYSLKIAHLLHIEKQVAFDSHKKLRELGLLERVEPLIIQYRKGIVDNKWIKHRNHTYYDLTAKGRSYLNYREKNE